MAGTVILFDFDRTLIDSDSDKWVVDQFGMTKLFDEICLTMPWNSVVNRMMEEIHLLGKTIEEIAECLKRVPLHPQIKTAIKSAHSLGSDLRIASDANAFFIETILKHNGLLDYFSEINTNPTFVDEQGRLRILPFTSMPHGCSCCPPHMCKGKIVERIQSSFAKDGVKKRFIYVGDGRGDYCPSLKLIEGDFIMPRIKYPLSDLIRKNSSLVKAEIHEWSNGEEFEETLLKLITT